MEISLLHIGLMKTASTYMQNTWSNDPGTCLSWNGTFSFMQTLRKATLEGELKPDDKLDIQIDAQPTEDQQIIVSNEGFSTAFLNGAQNAQQQIPSYVELASAALGKLLPNLDNALVVVREPISWIRSMHIQSIKEGGFDTGQDFVKKNRHFILNSLNLAHIAQCYSAHFPKLAIAPFELLKEDEDRFWSLVASECGINAPTAKGTERNASLSRDDAGMLAKLNRQSRILIEALQESTSYTMTEERDSLIKSYQGCFPWMSRRFVEFASEERKSELRSSLDERQPPSDFFEFSLDSELTDAIAKQYIAPLKDYDQFDKRFVEQYENALHASN